MTASHAAGLAWAVACIAVVAVISRSAVRDWRQKRADVEYCRQLGRALVREQVDGLADDLMAVADAVQGVGEIEAADFELWRLEFGADA